MFTGIIQELGEIVATKAKGGGLQLSIRADLARQLKSGGSININGACQSAFDISDNCFYVWSSEETIGRTNFRGLRSGEKVNLELPLALSDPLGGHLVSGHIDDVGRITALNRAGQGWLIQIGFDPRYARHMIEKGSVAVDGISLTCYNLTDNAFSAAIIPETYKKTNLRFRSIGDKVNLEFDLIAKYIEKLIAQKVGGVTLDYLSEHGYEVKHE